MRDGELSEKRCDLILRGTITTTDDEIAEAQAMENAAMDAFEAKNGYRPLTWAW